MDIKTIKGNLIERSDTLARYFREINKYPVLSAEEEYDLILKIKNGDNEAKEKLINSNQRFVVAIAKRYANNDNIMDLIDEGNLGLMSVINDIDKYDTTKGTRFLSYAVWYIRRSIQYYIMNTNMFVRRTNNIKLGNKMTKVKNKYFGLNGRYPTEDEIIDMLKKDFDITILKQSDVFDITTESVNEYIDEDQNTLEDTKAFTDKTASYNEYEETIDKEYTKTLVSKLLSMLNERDRTIVKMYFGIGYDKEYNNYEIGEELGLTSERIRQVINDVTKKLHRALSFVKV